MRRPDNKNHDHHTSRIAPYELGLVVSAFSLVPKGTPRHAVTTIARTGTRVVETLGAKRDAWIPDPHGRGGLLLIRTTLRRVEGRSVVAKVGNTSAARRVLSIGVDDGRILNEQIALPGPADGPLFPTRKGTFWNPSNFGNRVWRPALYAAYVKQLSDEKRDRWLSKVPEDLRDAAVLLTLPRVTVSAVANARPGHLSGRHLRFVDADGDTRWAEIPFEMARRLSQVRTGPREWFVRRADGSRVTVDAVLTQVFGAPLAAAGLSFDRPIHQLRHTFAWLVANANPELPEKEL